ncbi:MAG: tRNA lysidine(34) synthetase TilS [Candidatus Rokubacteria bacterium]|nr:tRNA lysidine(34) synthetase TilS [Candidatus Rokubacteria bacterium]
MAGAGTDVLDVVRDTVRRHAMLAGGELVLVAVSGGGDSIALLHLLVRLAPEWRLRLHVLHVDHGLRADSSRDAEFVRAVGARLGVPVSVAAVAVERRGSLEEAARVARYRALETHADRLGAQRIAVGHTADDQAETVLMRLFEGASVRGLAAIPPVRGRIIRPLLGARRGALRAELERAGLGWVDDPTNADPKFLRNRVRHELLPTLAACYDADLVAALTRVAGHARASVETMERLAAAELERLASVSTDAVTLPSAGLVRLPREVAAEVLRQAAGRLGGGGPLRAWAHRGLARVLATPPPRRPFRLGAVRVEVSSGMVRLARGPARVLDPHPLSVPGRLELPEIGLVFEAWCRDASGYAIPRSRTLVAFDADRLAPPLVVRRRRRGDRFRPFGGGERRLKAFLIDAKVPRWDRDRLPIVESGGEIVWVGGVRRGAAAPVTGETVRVVELVLKPLAKSSPDQ